MLFSTLTSMLSEAFELDTQKVWDQNLISVRLFEKEISEFRDDVLYIGSATELPLHNVMYKSFLVFDAHREDSSSKIRNNLICVKHTSDLFSIINRTQDLLSLARAREYDANYQKLFTTTGLDELLDRLSMILNNPALVIDQSGNILASTAVDYFQQSPVWCELLEEGLCDISLDYSALSRGATTLQRITDTHDAIVSPIVLENNRMVVLLIAGLFTPVSSTQFEFVSTGALIIHDKYSEEVYDRRRAEFSLEDSVRKLISGNKNIKIGRELLERSLFLSPDAGFFVAISDLPSDTATLRNIMTRFRQIPKLLVFTHQQYIVYFAQDTPPVTVYLGNLMRTARELGIILGISQPFASLQQTQNRYQQAITAKNHATMLELEPGLYDFDSFCYLHPFTRPIDYSVGKDELLQKYCGSIVWYLKLYDDEMGTPYFETLREFVYVDRNYKECAARLNIHRNTLSYRISQISAILGERNLFKPDMFFMLSYCFRLYDYMDRIL